MIPPTAYDDGVFIVKGPNFVLMSWKYGMIGTLSNQHPKILTDTSFHFQINSIGSGDRNGPGILLKNMFSNDCLTASIDPITTSIKLRMQPCSGVFTLKKATQKGDDTVQTYSKQKFFWTGRYLFSSVVANDNLGQLQSIAVTSTLFGSSYLKSKRVQLLTLASINEISVEKYYTTACLFEGDATLQSQLEQATLKFSSVSLLNESLPIATSFKMISCLLLFVLFFINLYD